MSLRAAIDAKCRDCIYDPADAGNWRVQVEGCRLTDCPLHPYRPLTTAGHAARRAAELAAMSPADRARAEARAAAAAERMRNRENIDE